MTGRSEPWSAYGFHATSVEWECFRVFSVCVGWLLEVYTNVLPGPDHEMAKALEKLGRPSSQRSIRESSTVVGTQPTGGQNSGLGCSISIGRTSVLWNRTKMLLFFQNEIERGRKPQFRSLSRQRGPVSCGANWKSVAGSRKALALERLHERRGVEVRTCESLVASSDRPLKLCWKAVQVVDREHHTLSLRRLRLALDGLRLPPVLHIDHRSAKL